LSFTKQQSRGAILIKWFGTLLSIALLIYLLSQQDWQEIRQALFRIQLWRFAAAFMLMVISRFAVASRWHALLRVASDKISWRRSVRLTFAGLFSTNFLPTTIGGDIVRLAGAIQTGLDGAVAAASLVADRLVGMFGMVLMLPFGIVPILNWFSANRAASLIFQPPGYSVAAGFGFKAIWQKIIVFIRKTFKTINLWLEQPVALIHALFFTGIHVICFSSILWILFNGLHDTVPYLMIAGLYSFVYLVTLLPVSVNGYGLQELSLSVIFSEVGGVSLHNGLTVALVFRILTMLASLPGAFFVPDIISGHRGSADTQGGDATSFEVSDS
jgi:uncharacterized membrane protein YbhN (UPF0104 family)